MYRRSGNGGAILRCCSTDTVVVVVFVVPLFDHCADLTITNKADGTWNVHSIGILTSQVR